MKRVLLLLIMIISVISCSNKQEVTFSLSQSSISIPSASGSKLVNVSSNGQWTAASDSEWCSVSPVQGSGNLVVKLQWKENEGARRNARISFSYEGGSTTLAVKQAGVGGEVEVTGLDELSAPLTTSLIHSRAVTLYKQKNIMQGFDFTDSKHYYYSQGPANDKNQYVSFCAGPNTMYSNYMTLERFGHMTQIVAEAAPDGKTYIWCNSNGQSTSDGYGNNLSISRVEYKAGAVYSGGYAGDTYVLNKAGHYDAQVAIDFDNRKMLIGSRKPGVSMRYFWIFNLDEVLALPLKTMNVTVTLGSNTSITDDGVSRAETRTIQARDLNDAQVVGYFEIPRGTSKDQVYYYSHQGHEIYGNTVWFYEGNAVSDGTENYNSFAYVTVYDYDGKVLIPRTAVKAIEDNTAMNKVSFTKIGYAEAESIKIKDGKLYLGLACHNGSGAVRYAEILGYDLD